MNVHEYQAKEILARFGVPVPAGEVAETTEQIREIAERLGAPVMVKAQVHAGGRGKGGGIKFCSSVDEAVEKGSAILGMTLVTPQTGAQGRLSRHHPGVRIRTTGTRPGRRFEVARASLLEIPA